jgi:hypothetical protein
MAASAYADLKVDLTTGDIVVTGGKLQTVSGMEYAIQHWVAALHLFEGEWYYNSLLGLPYKKQIFVKNPNMTVVRALFAETTRSVPLITAVHSMKLGLDTTKRIMTVEAVATVDGEQVTLTTDLLIAPGKGGPGSSDG